MRGKSPPSEHVLEKIELQKSLGFSKRFEKGDHFSFFFKISLCRISSRIFKKKDTNQAKYVPSIRLKCAFLHITNLNTRCDNEIYRSSATIHN